eukprot:UN26566
MNTPVGQMGHMVESASKSLFQTAPSSTKSLHATFRSSPWYNGHKLYFAKIHIVQVNIPVQVPK